MHHVDHSCKVEITRSDNIRMDCRRMTKDLIEKGYIYIARHNDQRKAVGSQDFFFGLFLINFKIGWLISHYASRSKRLFKPLSNKEYRKFVLHFGRRKATLPEEVSLMNNVRKKER